MAERPKLGSIDATGAARNRGVSPQERDPVPSRSNGRPLEPAARGYFEPRFGHDFSRVRVHYDPHAEALAHALNARAYTVGRDIVFGKDQYAPGTSAGRRLLGHELTHVVQADLAGSSARPPDMAAPQGAAEAEAHRAGARVALGMPAGTISAPHARLALTPTSAAVEPLISHSLTDWEVTAADETAVLAQLRADPDLSSTVTDLDAAGMLDALIDRVDEPANRREMLQLMGARLNPAARALVEPRITALGLQWELQYNLGRLGVTAAAPAFSTAPFASVVGGTAASPFSGSGATGVSPTTRGISVADQALLAAGHGSTTAAFSNPVASFPGDLPGYLASLTSTERAQQAELLARQPISTVEAASYAGAIPSRADVIRAAASAHNLHPAMVAAILLAEQRDQSANEDAADYLSATSRIMRHPSSIGLGQVTIPTAGRRDLFEDLLSSSTRSGLPADPDQTARLLASDEFNIFAVARYVRWVADQGATTAPATLPNTFAAFPGLDLPVYAANSSTWPEDNIAVLGMYYTSRPWTDDLRSQGWGWFVLEAYHDVVASGVL